MYKTLEDVERVINKGKKQEVLDTFVASYLQGLEKDKWVEAIKAEHETLYPKQLPNPDYVAPLPQRIVNPSYVEGGEAPYWISNPDYVEPLDEFIDNPDYIDFDTWINETEEVQVGTKDVLDEDGLTVIGTEPIYEDRAIRVFEDVPVDVEAWKSTSEIYKNYLDGVKDEALNRLTVTISSGKVFYADPTSRSDLTDAILLGQASGITETAWKLAEPLDGVPPIDGKERIYLVTVQELAEAGMLALQAKGKIVGAL